MRGAAFLPLCLLPLASSCVSLGAPLDRSLESMRLDRSLVDVEIRVRNDHYLPVRLTAIWPEMDYYLGEIRPGEDLVFRIPGSLVANRGNPRFLADPNGSTQEFLSDAVDMYQCRWVDWRLKRNLLGSRPFAM